MEVHTLFLQMLIILLFAKIFAEVAVRLQSPSVIGELLAGMVIVIALTTLAPPFALKWLFKRYHKELPFISDSVERRIIKDRRHVKK